MKRKRPLFGTGRPQPPSEEPSCGIWVMEKVGDQWADPKYHGPGMYVTTTTDGTIYVTDTSNPEDWGVIVRSRLINGTYQEFELLGGGINKSYHDAHPCIAPDERFLIFDSDRPGALGGEEDNDLYISFRNEDGSWGEAVQLKDVSTEGDNMTAYLSPDGKFLFYYAYHDIYWISSDVVKKYRENWLMSTNVSGEEFPTRFYSTRIPVLNKQRIPDGPGNVYWIDAKIIQELKPKELK